jgi:hypothetical protein
MAPASARAARLILVFISVLSSSDATRQVKPPPTTGFSGAGIEGTLKPKELRYRSSYDSKGY